MQDITHATYDGGANPYAAGGGAAGSVAASDVYNELPAAQRSIMTFIASRAQDPEQGEEGIHVEAVVRSMGGSEAKVRAEIATLIEDGHLYETIDDQQCVLCSLDSRTSGVLLTGCSCRTLASTASCRRLNSGVPRSACVGGCLLCVPSSCAVPHVTCVKPVRRFDGGARDVLTTLLACSSDAL